MPPETSPRAKDRLKALIWSRGMLDALVDATRDAIQFNQSAFTVDLDRKHRNFVFETQQALDLIEHLSPDFAANPHRQYPENKEGAEP